MTAQLPPRVSRDKAIQAIAAAFPNVSVSSTEYLSTKGNEYLAVRIDFLLNESPVDDPAQAQALGQARSRALAVLQEGVQ